MSPPQASALIAAGLEPRLIYPSDPEYALRKASYFDQGASRLSPACFLQPRSAEEVCKGLGALAKAQQPFAVRSGGCNTTNGSNNIGGEGVTVDLTLLNSVEYDAVSETVRLGPGATWLHVYEELEKVNRTTGGARAGSIGVGGFLLGGGLSLYSSHYGFGCDNVVAYEVALADGTLVAATAEEHADLFRALKGGGSNFGIVTCFTMKTLPMDSKIWGGIALKKTDRSESLSRTFSDFTAHAADHPDCHVIMMCVHMQPWGGDMVGAFCYNVAGEEKPPPLKAFTDDGPDVMAQFQTGTMHDMVSYISLPDEHFNLWYTLSFRNDAAIVARTSGLLFELSDTLQTEMAADDYHAYCLMQPIPRIYAQRSAEAAGGGNVMGLGDYPHDAVMIQISVSVKTPELGEWARSLVRGMYEKVRDFAKERDAECPWLYMNYAAKDQEVIHSFGPQNVARIREVAVKYDPDGVFSRLCPGGFKVDRTG